MSAKFTIKQIFDDHWNDFLSSGNQVRPVVDTEVRRMLSCGDPHNGYSLYWCPHCNHFKYVPFRCRSRFCNTCGTAYQADRANSISFKMIRCRHRHIVFTIPFELRLFFRHDRKLLHLLFHAASMTVLDWMRSLNRKESFTPGIISCLHTFGRDLKWNPHIHMLVTEGASGNFSPWRSFSFFPYSMLRKHWQTALLSLMEKALGKKTFRPFKNRIYSHTKDGFYVHARPSRLNSPKAVSNYITRYIGRPAMAQSRITSYDGQNVSFWYFRHEDGLRQDETIPASEFIQRLIVHIPEKHFHMLRYYGLYAKHHKFDARLQHLLSPLLRSAYKIHSRWVFRIELSFGYDPTKCSCGTYMEFLGTFFPGQLAFHPP